MLVVDTDELPCGDRAEFVQNLISATASTSVARFDNPSEIWARMTLVDLGPGRVFNTRSTGMTLRRSLKASRMADEQRFALAVPLHNRCRFAWGREEQYLNTRDMLLVDLSEPYEFGWHGDGSSYAFQVDPQQLQLSADTIRTAATRLSASPLFPIVRDHIVGLTTQAESLAAEPAQHAVGTATVDLMRALIVSAARDSRLRADTASSTLFSRVLAYTSHHLTEPDLTPDRIAAAHFISVRHLYRLLEEHDVSLEQWIIDRRLKGASIDLVSPRGANRPISLVASEWGFANPSFFASRFRAKYGVTPTQWRQHD